MSEVDSPYRHIFLIALSALLSSSNYCQLEKIIPDGVAQPVIIHGSIEALNNSNVNHQISAVNIWTPDNGFIEPFYSSESRPRILFAQAGIELEIEDRIFWNGMEVNNEDPLPPAENYTLQYMPAGNMVVLNSASGEKEEYKEEAWNIGRALWDAGYYFTWADSLSAPLNQPVERPVSIAYQKAVPIYIQDDGHEIISLTSSANIGYALAAAGISLQGVDHCIPAEEMPLPSDGIVQVIRTSEELVIEQEPIAFAVERQPNPNMPVGQEIILQEGHNGSRITQTRVKYTVENEDRRYTQLQLLAAEPQSQIVSYGTLAALLPVPTIANAGNYWAVKEMYATSYYPCGFANGRCSYITASGRTLEKGIVAVTLEWYKALKGTQVYIPGYGYGIIADTGAGIEGKDWIDLGYGNEDYVPWSKIVTVYFLNPPPGEIPWFLN